MNIQINSNAFTKLNKMVGVSNVNIELLKYYLDNNNMKGEVRIFGEFYSNEKEFEENNGLNSFENIIPFEVVFTKGVPNINSVEINNFEYYELVGRGIEASFNINVEYELIQEEERVQLEEALQEQEDFLTSNEVLNEVIEEETKADITEQVDRILTEKMKLKDDNFLEISPRNEKDSKGVIKVIYYDESHRIKELCDELKLSYEEVIQENKKYDFSGNHRIIVKESNEYRK